jgi:hypothetical protein
MAKCPVCQTENPDDFGLVTCKSCGSPFLVEIDGSSSASSAVTATGGVPTPINVPMFELSNGAPENVGEFEKGPPEFSPTELAVDQPPEEMQLPPPPTPPIEDLRSIAEFGNSEASLAREGAYRFTLYVGGIDTAEIRQEIRFQLSDSRFLWDVDALLATIKNGELIVSDISAVKAALAVQRLKLLPVDLKWEQHAIHQNH